MNDLADKEFQLALAVLENCRRYIAAHKTQRWDARRVKKLKLRKGGSFPTFLVLDGCCTTSLPWTLE